MKLHHFTAEYVIYSCRLYVNEIYFLDIPFGMHALGLLSSRILRCVIPVVCRINQTIR
jgi:hypothetical protein